MSSIESLFRLDDISHHLFSSRALKPLAEFTVHDTYPYITTEQIYTVLLNMSNISKSTDVLFCQQYQYLVNLLSTNRMQVEPIQGLDPSSSSAAAAASTTSSNDDITTITQQYRILSPFETRRVSSMISLLNSMPLNTHGTSEISQDSINILLSDTIPQYNPLHVDKSLLLNCTELNTLVLSHYTSCNTIPSQCNTLRSSTRHPHSTTITICLEPLNIHDIHTIITRSYAPVLTLLSLSVLAKLFVHKQRLLLHNQNNNTTTTTTAGEGIHNLSSSSINLNTSFSSNYNNIFYDIPKGIMFETKNDLIIALQIISIPSTQSIHFNIKHNTIDELANVSIPLIRPYNDSIELDKQYIPNVLPSYQTQLFPSMPTTLSDSPSDVSLLSSKLCTHYKKVYSTRCGMIEDLNNISHTGLEQTWQEVLSEILHSNKTTILKQIPSAYPLRQDYSRDNNTTTTPQYILDIDNINGIDMIDGQIEIAHTNHFRWSSSNSLLLQCPQPTLSEFVGWQYILYREYILLSYILAQKQQQGNILFENILKLWYNDYTNNTLPDKYKWMIYTTYGDFGGGGSSSGNNIIPTSASSSSSLSSTDQHNTSTTSISSPTRFICLNNTLYKEYILYKQYNTTSTYLLQQIPKENKPYIVPTILSSQYCLPGHITLETLTRVTSLFFHPRLLLGILLNPSSPQYYHPTVRSSSNKNISPTDTTTLYIPDNNISPLESMIDTTKNTYITLLDIISLSQGTLPAGIMTYLLELSSTLSKYERRATLTTLADVGITAKQSGAVQQGSALSYIMPTLRTLVAATSEYLISHAYTNSALSPSVPLDITLKTVPILTGKITPLLYILYNRLPYLIIDVFDNASHSIHSYTCHIYLNNLKSKQNNRNHTSSSSSSQPLLKIPPLSQQGTPGYGQAMDTLFNALRSTTSRTRQDYAEQYDDKIENNSSNLSELRQLDKLYNQRKIELLNEQSNTDTITTTTPTTPTKGISRDPQLRTYRNDFKRLKTTALREIYAVGASFYKLISECDSIPAPINHNDPSLSSSQQDILLDAPYRVADILTRMLLPSMALRLLTASPLYAPIYLSNPLLPSSTNITLHQNMFIMRQLSQLPIYIDKSSNSGNDIIHQTTPPQLDSSCQYTPRSSAPVMYALSKFNEVYTDYDPISIQDRYPDANLPPLEEVNFVQNQRPDLIPGDNDLFNITTNTMNTTIGTCGGAGTSAGYIDDNDDTQSTYFHDLEIQQSMTAQELDDNYNEIQSTYKVNKSFTQNNTNTNNNTLNDGSISPQLSQHGIDIAGHHDPLRVSNGNISRRSFTDAAFSSTPLMTRKRSLQYAKATQQQHNNNNNRYSNHYDPFGNNNDRDRDEHDTTLSNCDYDEDGDVDAITPHSNNNNDDGDDMWNNNNTTNNGTIFAQKPNRQIGQSAPSTPKTKPSSHPAAFLDSSNGLLLDPNDLISPILPQRQQQQQDNTIPSPTPPLLDLDTTPSVPVTPVKSPQDKPTTDIFSPIEPRYPNGKDHVDPDSSLVSQPSQSSPHHHTNNIPPGSPHGPGDNLNDSIVGFHGLGGFNSDDDEYDHNTSTNRDDDHGDDDDDDLAHHITSIDDKNDDIQDDDVLSNIDNITPPPSTPHTNIHNNDTTNLDNISLNDDDSDDSSHSHLLVSYPNQDWEHCDNPLAIYTPQQLECLPPSIIQLYNDRRIILDSFAMIYTHDELHNINNSCPIELYSSLEALSIYGFPYNFLDNIKQRLDDRFNISFDM